MPEELVRFIFLSNNLPYCCTHVCRNKYLSELLFAPVQVLQPGVFLVKPLRHPRGARHALRLHHAPRGRQLDRSRSLPHPRPAAAAARARCCQRQRRSRSPRKALGGRPLSLTLTRLLLLCRTLSQGLVFRVGTIAAVSPLLLLRGWARFGGRGEDLGSPLRLLHRVDRLEDHGGQADAQLAPHPARPVY